MTEDDNEFKKKILELVDAAMNSAIEIVNKNQELQPMGFASMGDGKYDLAGGAGETYREHLNLIVNGFREKAAENDVIAIAIIFQGALRSEENCEPRNAIVVHVESDKIVPRRYIRPYKIQDDAVVYDIEEAVEADYMVWQRSA